LILCNLFACFLHFQERASGTGGDRLPPRPDQNQEMLNKVSFMIDPKHPQNLGVSRRAGCFHVPFGLPALVGALGRQPLLLFGCLLLAKPAAVQAQFTYTVSNQTVTITGYTGTHDVVAIPSTMNGLPVTGIGDRAFDGSSVTRVAIPNSVSTIGDSAFAYCYRLTSVAIPNTVTRIGEDAFGYCSSLTNIMVDPLNSAYSSVDGVLFNQNQTTLLEFSGGKAGDYTIPPSVINIWPRAFSECTGLTGITIPNSVTNIGDSAFSGCPSLARVTIGDSVTSIGVGAFGGTSLRSLIIPESVISIGDAAFEYCDHLTSIAIPNSVTNIGVTSLYFQGDAPSLGGTNVFVDDKTTIYYLPGTTGWGSTFGGSPTALWSLPYPLILNSSLGVRSNQFAFTVSWATNASLVVEATPDLKNPNWSQLSTNALQRRGELHRPAVGELSKPVLSSAITVI
jgi:hypothetical protein